MMMADFSCTFPFLLPIDLMLSSQSEPGSYNMFLDCAELDPTY